MSNCFFILMYFLCYDIHVVLLLALHISSFILVIFHAVCHVVWAAAISQLID